MSAKYPRGAGPFLARSLLKLFIMLFEDVKWSKKSVVLMCLNRYHIFSPILKFSTRLFCGGHTLFAGIWTHENNS